MNLQNFLSLNGLLTGIIAAVFGFMVIFKDRKNIINQTLFGLTMTTALWQLGYWRWLMIYDNQDLALFWCRVLSVGSHFLAVFYFHWIVSLLGLNKQKKKLIFVSYFVAGIFLFFIFSPWFVSSVEPVGNYFAFWPKAGFLYSIYIVLMFLGLAPYALFLLFRHYKKSVGQKRNQIKYVIIATILAFGGGETNFPLWYDIPILPIGNVLVVLYPILFSYAIIRHRLMDIKFVLRQSSVYLFSLATVLIFMTTVKLISAQLFTAPPIWIDLLVLLIAVYIFSPIKHYYYRLANKYFFSSLYDSRELIADLSDKLRSTIEIGKIYEYVSEILVNALHVTAFGVMTYDEKRGVYVAQYNRGFNVGKQKIFPVSKEVYEIFTKRNQPIITEAIKADDFPGSGSILNLLTKANVALLSPLNMKDKTVGMMVFGPKESKDPFNEEDLKVLEILGTQIAFAMENALLYAESVKFNIQLNEEKNKIAAIIANFIDPIIFVDRYNNINLINPAAKNILGLTEKSLGVSIDTSNNCPMSNFRTVIKKEFQIKEIGNLKSTDHHSEEMSILVNNQELIYKITTIRVFDDQTNHLGLMKIFVNLTREKGIDKMKSEFISIAAHQLRTPLSAIKWVIKMILDGDAGELSLEQQELLNKGYLSNERVIRLVNDLLNVSRIEEGKFGFNFESTDFKEVLDTSISNIDSLIDKSHQELKIEIPPKLPKIYLDKERIIMVIQNLLSNAIKYTPEYGKIEVIIKVDKQYLNVKIKDQGVGIPAEDQPKIFSKFFRAANVVKLETEGSGLGLFMVKNIIEKHKGQVSLKSEEGKGTEVSFTLPINGMISL
jgi:signal transduction histidine kinase